MPSTIEADMSVETSRKSIFNQSLLPCRERLLELCRVCGQSRNETRCFSMIQEGIVKEHLATYLNIQISDGDGLPHLVCPTCAQVLIDWDFVIKTSRAFELALASLSDNAADRTEVNVSENQALCGSAEIGLTNVDNPNLLYGNNIGSNSGISGSAAGNQAICVSAEIDLNNIENLTSETNLVFNARIEVENSNLMYGITEISASTAVLSTKREDLSEEIDLIDEDICEDEINIGEINVDNSNLLFENHVISNERISDSSAANEEISTSSAGVMLSEDMMHCDSAQVKIEPQEHLPDCSVQSASSAGVNLSEDIMYCDSAQVKIEPQEHLPNCSVQSASSADNQSISASSAGVNLSEDMMHCDSAQRKIEPQEHLPDCEGQSNSAACGYQFENQSIAMEINGPTITIKTEPPEEPYSSELTPNLAPERDPLQTTSTNISSIKPEAHSEQYVIENPIPSAKRGRGRPRKHPIPVHKNKTIPKFRSIIAKYKSQHRNKHRKLVQMTFNLKNSNDVSKILKFQQLHVIIEPVKIKPSENTSDCEIIMNLRQEIASSINSNVKEQYCIICNCNVENYIEHLEDIHIENPLVNEILTEHSSNIQNRVLNSVINERKSLKKSNILPINNIQLLCFNKIIELLPENIRNVIAKDRVIKQYGIKLIKKFSVSHSNLFTSITHKLKQIVKLLLISRQSNPDIVNLASLLTVENCSLIFDSMKQIGEYDFECSIYKYPYVVKQIGNTVNICTRILCKVDSKYRFKFVNFTENFDKMWRRELKLAENSVIMNSVGCGVKKLKKKRKKGVGSREYLLGVNEYYKIREPASVEIKVEK